MFNKKTIVDSINNGLSFDEFINSVEDTDLKYYTKYVQLHNKEEYTRYILTQFYNLVKSEDIKNTSVSTKSHHSDLLLIQQSLDNSENIIEETKKSVQNIIETKKSTPNIFEETKQLVQDNVEIKGSIQDKINSSENDIQNKKLKQDINLEDYDKYLVEMDREETETNIKLSDEQKLAYYYIKNGKSIFMTGLAGTGKSFCIEFVIKKFLETRPRSRLGLTSTTGCSAILIGGTTIHSFLGIGLGLGSAQLLARETKIKKSKIYTTLKRLELLIIDEISMMSMELFDKISEYLSIIRDCDEPFGGVQLLLTGDFCQLSPVKSDMYCFESELWKKIDMKIVQLIKSFRQEDENFVNILNELRFGDCSNSTYEILKKYKNRTYDNGVVPMKLFSTNKAVDKCNDEEINKLIEQSVSIKYKINQLNISEAKANDIIKKANIDNNLTLCIGSQVMVTYNVSLVDNVVNGTIGKVTYVARDRVTIFVYKTGLEFDINYIPYNESTISGDRITTKTLFMYIPLKLAYATTIHKIQGQTIDYLEVDLGSSIFSCGQAYTAISRIKKIEDLNITKLSRASFLCDTKVIDFYKSINQN